MSIQSEILAQSDGRMRNANCCPAPITERRVEMQKRKAEGEREVMGVGRGKGKCGNMHTAG